MGDKQQQIEMDDWGYLRAQAMGYKGQLCECPSGVGCSREKNGQKGTKWSQLFGDKDSSLVLIKIGINLMEQSQ